MESPRGAWQQRRRVPAGRIVSSDHHAGVVEPDPARQLHAGLLSSPAAWRRRFVERHGGRVVEHELGLGHPRLDPPARPRRHHEPRHVGQHRESFDQPVDVGGGDLDRSAAFELLHPARGDRRRGRIGRRLKPRNAVGEDDEPRPEDRLGFVERLPLAAAHEHAAERSLRGSGERFVVIHGGLAAGFCGPHVLVVRLQHEGKLPGCAPVPRQRYNPLRVAPWLRLDDEPTGLTEHREVRGRRLRADDNP